MDAADAPGREDAEARRPRNCERAAHRRRADRALDGGGREVTRACLPRVGVEARELLLREADAHLAVEDADRRRHRSRRPHLPFRLEADLDALARGEAVRDERRLERDHGSAGVERVPDLVGEADHADRSISTKRLSSPCRTWWKPARR